MIDDGRELNDQVTESDVLSTLQPIVRRFDFEGDDAGANSLPPHFYRFVAPDLGFPAFGETRIVDGRGYPSTDVLGGRNAALEMELQGGSLSVRIGTSVVPVLPMTDYVVACRVRTEGIQHAHARLIAWLCDSSGRIIESSRVESRPMQSEHNWSVLSVEVQGDHADAADLVFELQLVQPSQRSNPGVDSFQPMVQDVRGRAWFDDITVSHLPRVILAFNQPGNIFTVGDPVQIAIAVHELASKHLNARLRIFNLNGHLVSDDSFVAPRGREPSLVTVNLSHSGWYRAVLDVTSEKSLSRRRWVDFLVLAAGPKPLGRPSPFGVWLSADAGIDDARVVHALRSGMAIVPAWHRDSTLLSADRADDRRMQFIEQLVLGDARVAFSLIDVPDELARSVASQARGAVDVLHTDAALWRPYLDDLLMHFGLSINDWIVGDGLHVDDRALAKASEALAAFLPAPNLRRVWPITMQPHISTPAATSLLHVPASIPPESLHEYLYGWLKDENGTSIVNLDVLPAASQSNHSPRQRLADAMLRGLHAWRAGADHIVIDQPWRSSDGHFADAAPDPVALAWHTLSTQLAGKRFLAELSLDESVHAWIAVPASTDESARADGDALLIVWSDRDPLSGDVPIAMQIGERPMHMVDSLGNTSILVPEHQHHQVSASDLPVFLKGVSLEIVMFRSGMRIEPDFMPAAAKVHEHHLIIHNPWDTAISGSVRLTATDDLQVLPSIQEFTIAARGETRLPVQFVPQRGILAGQRHLAAEVTIHAEQQHVLRAHLHMDVGLKDIELNVATSVVENAVTGERDLLVNAAVTNRSATPVHLDVDLLAENISQLRRTIAALPSGQTQTRTFRINNGAAILSGQQIRIGVSQRDGVARLNQVIVIGEHGMATEFAASKAEP